MNVFFTLADAPLEMEFLSGAAQHGFFNLAGRRTSAGIRASIRNAMPQAGFEAFAQFMEDFARNRG